jgi:hypothetical protein
MRSSPEIVEVDSSQLEEVLRRAEQSLDEQDAELIRKVFQSYVYVSDLVEDKNTSIRRLRQLFFGGRTEKMAALVGRQAEQQGEPKTAPSDDAPSSDAANSVNATDAIEADAAEKTPTPGHGRNGVNAYRGAERIAVSHPTLTAGDACPECGRGTVYEKAPGVLVRIKGGPPLAATVYQLQKLRCHLCGRVFTAPIPAEAGLDKYDATAGAMIGLLKYGSGLPFNRLDGLQGHLEVPLPASTQWDVVKAVATDIAPAFTEFIRQAAQGDVLHNDDTTVRILELMGERARKAALADEPVAAKLDQGDQRSGLFTSGVVALRDSHRVALFFSGPRHAGENLADVLRLRAAELPPPIQMCDALSRNLPRNLPDELQTILANCLAHARRQFVEVYERFPEPCRYLLEALAVVYRNDALTRERQLSPAARLEFHQQASGPTMQGLHAWLSRQFVRREADRA